MRAGLKLNNVWSVSEQQLVGFQIFKGQVDVIHTTNPQNPLLHLKGDEIVQLTARCVSLHTGYVPNNVWSGPKHLVTLEYVGQPFEMLWTGPRKVQ